jgi:type I restriction enzyme S subunit
MGLDSLTESTLAEVCSLVTDGTHDTPKRVASGYPLIKAKEITGGRIDFETCDQISKEEHLEVIARSKPECGDTLFAHIGASLGEAAFVNTTREFSIKNVALFKPNPAVIDARYLYYLVISPAFQALAKGTKTGSAQPFLGLSQLRGHCIRYHRDLPTQRRIGAILSAYDELMENSQRRIRILETMARALYREWFVHFHFPGHEKVPRVASPLGDIPQGWEVKPFSALASYVNGYAFKPDDWGAEGKPIVKIKELKAGVTADTPRNPGDGIPARYNVQDGDVLFSWSADLDTYLWMGGEGLLNQHLFNVVPFDGFSRAFCFYALKESMARFRALSLGATMHHIKRSALHQVFTLLPPGELRKRFEVLVEPMHQQLITLTKHFQNLRRTRDLLLPRLLSGGPALNEENPGEAS